MHTQHKKILQKNSSSNLIRFFYRFSTTCPAQNERVHAQATQSYFILERIIHVYVMCVHGGEMLNFMLSIKRKEVIDWSIYFAIFICIIYIFIRWTFCQNGSSSSHRGGKSFIPSIFLFFFLFFFFLALFYTNYITLHPNWDWAYSINIASPRDSLPFKVIISSTVFF